MNLGIPVGLTAKISKFYHDDVNGNKLLIKAYLRHFLIIVFLLSLASVGFLLFFSDKILSFLIEDYTGYKIVYVMAILSLPALVLFPFIEAFLKSTDRLNKMILISIISSISSMIVLVPLIIFFHIEGIAVYLFLLGFVPIFVSAYIFRKDILHFFKIGRKVFLEKNVKSDIMKIGVTSISAGLMHQGAIILIRKFIIANFGLVDNGIYQSVLTISLNYFSIVYLFLNSYTLPRLSSRTLPSDTIEELKQNLKFLMLMLVPMIVILFTFRSAVIRLLFSKDFSSASDLMSFQLMGDFFRSLAALLGLWLVPYVRVKALFIIDLTFNLILLCLPWLLCNLFYYNIIFVPVSYLIAFFMHFMFYFLYTRYSIGFRFGKKLHYYLVFSILVLIVTFVVSGYYIFLGYFVVSPLLLLWFNLSFNKDERKNIYGKVKNYAQLKFNRRKEDNK